MSWELFITLCTFKGRKAAGKWGPSSVLQRVPLNTIIYPLGENCVCLLHGAHGSQGESSSLEAKVADLENLRQTEGLGKEETPGHLPELFHSSVGK